MKKSLRNLTLYLIEVYCQKLIRKHIAVMEIFDNDDSISVKRIFSPFFVNLLLAAVGNNKSSLLGESFAKGLRHRHDQ